MVCPDLLGPIANSTVVFVVKDIMIIRINKTVSNSPTERVSVYVTIGHVAGYIFVASLGCLT